MPYGSLEEGWGHIAAPRSDMDQILDMLTPRRYQQQTTFAGGSHFGPSRYAYVPEQNISAAANALKVLQGSQMNQLELEKAKRAEEILAKLQPQQRGGATVEKNWQDLSPFDQLSLAAAGYSVPGMAGGRGTSTSRGMIGPDGQMVAPQSTPSQLSEAQTKRADEIRTWIEGLRSQLIVAETVEEADAIKAQIKEYEAMYMDALSGNGGNRTPAIDQAPAIPASPESGTTRRNDGGGTITVGGKTYTIDQYNRGADAISVEDDEATKRRLRELSYSWR